MTYPYVPAKYDYGVRTGPALGLLFHMAEGGGTVGYLSRTPPRGVSVHAVCDVRGVVTQMLPWAHISGSLNPSNRSTDKGYFGRSHLLAVLGNRWSDPNGAVLSMEIEGFASIGPSAEQVDAAVAWGLDMKRRYPALRGALGHADQTDTKRCPGTRPQMQAVFARVGGHGIWRTPTTNAPANGEGTLKITDPNPALVDVAKGVEMFSPSGQSLGLVSGPISGQVSPYEVEVGGGHYRLLRAAPDGVTQVVLVHNPDANARPVPPPAPADCAVQVETARRVALADARAALSALR